MSAITTTATINVPAGKIYTIKAVGECYVDLVSGQLGAGYTAVRLVNKSQDFGPYGADSVLAVRVVSGTATYGEKGGAQTAAVGAPLTLTLNESQGVTLVGATGATGASGTIQRYNSAGVLIETRAIAAGALQSIGAYPGGQTVVLTPTAGSIDAVVADASLITPSQRPKSDVLSACLSGFLDVPIPVVTDPYSLMVQTVLEAPYDAMRIGILNADNNAVAGVKVAIGSGTTLGAANGTLGLSAAGQPIGGAAFLPATFDGAATGTLAASPAIATDSNGTNYGGSECSVTWTDWMLNISPDRADGTSGLPTANIIITWPAGVKRSRLLMDGTTSQGWDNEAAVANRPFRVMAAATKDAVANSAWMLTSNGGCARTYTDFPPIIIQYTLRNGYGETLVIYGDSIREGAAANVQKFGYHREFQAMVSTSKEPVSICNLAVSASGMQAMEKRIASTIASFQRASVDIPSCTPNSLSTPQTAGNIATIRKSFASMRRMLNRDGLMVFTDTCLPSNSSVSPGQAGPKNYGASDMLYRVPYNTNIRNSGFRVTDYDALYPWAVDPSGQYCMPAALTPDGIHPGTALYKMMAAARAATWRGN